jgi:hypothetical protein
MRPGWLLITNKLFDHKPSDMRVIWIVFIVIVSSVFARGQAVVSNGQLVRTFDLSEKDAKGSPFWNQNWWQGQITMSNGSKVDHVRLKISTYPLAELNLKKVEGDSIVLALQKFKSAYLINPNNQDTVIFKKIQSNNNFQGELMRVIHEGRYPILARQSSILLSATGTNTSNIGRSHDEFLQKTEYFLHHPELGTLIKIKLTKKALLHFFPGKDAELSAFIHSNQLNVEKEKDAARLAAYYEQLINNNLPTHQ